MPKHPEPEPVTEEDVQLVRTARVLWSLSSPESIQILRRLALGAQSALSIATQEKLPADAVEILLYRFAEAGLVGRPAKSWWELTPLGRVAADAVRAVSRRL